MESWNYEVEQIINNITASQLSKIVDIGSLLKSAMNQKGEDHTKAISEIEKQLNENFDHESCNILMAIIGKLKINL